MARRGRAFRMAAAAGDDVRWPCRGDHRRCGGRFDAHASDATDGDATNDFDNILSVRLRATLAADRADQRVNGGALFTRDYAWRFSPRNLMYERNRN